MYKEFNGYCVVQDTEYTITVEYLDAGNNRHIKGLADCTYRQQHPEKDCSQCAILKKAPSEI